MTYTAPSAYVDECVRCGKPATEHEWPGGGCPTEPTWPRRVEPSPGPDDVVQIVLPERLARVFEERCLGSHTRGHTRLSAPCKFSEDDLPSYIIEVTDDRFPL